MSKFTNISTTPETTILLQAGDHATNSSNALIGSRFFSVNKITIVNHSANAATVTVFQDGLTVNSVTYPDYNITGAIVIPGEVSLVLDDKFTINLTTHSLKLTNSGSSPALTIRID
tara:strand:- start:39 stop:386 length:348 start_codon:yes stop_codon:yes gene_type:complete